jgi:hypothetical protein
VASRFANISENVGFALKMETVALFEKSAFQANATNCHDTRIDIRCYNETDVHRNLKEK